MGILTNNIRQKCLKCFFAVFLLSLCTPLRAEDLDFTERLLFDESLLGELTKRPEKTYEAAANVTVIPGKFLEKYAIRNINDLFEVLEGGWHAHKGMDEVLGLRGVIGYANDKILFLYNGLLFPTFLGLGENNWPAGGMDEVERIEIIKGPSTSIWGGQGTQGAINIVHKGAKQFQGLKTSYVGGKYGMSRYIINYAKKPTDDFSYQVLANSTYYKGFYRNIKEWWGQNVTNLDGHDLVNPIPDYEIFTQAAYKDFTFAYRRLESRTLRKDKDVDNRKYIENFADDVNIVLKKPEWFKNTDWVSTLRFNNFYQMYDVFHLGKNEGLQAYEMKTEKRYEIDTNFLLQPVEKFSVVLGAQAGVWSPQGSGPSTYWNPWTRNGDTGPGSIYAPPEFLPTFTEMGNDLAAYETYLDAKYKITEKISLTGGGRYVAEFNPGDQFRDEREKVHKFFPKTAAVYSPLQDLYVKLIYEQAFTRLNTFERYSAQVNIDERGKQKATTSETSELVFDWRPLPKLKVLTSCYRSILYDFANFIYTGGAWPDLNPGEYRGFFNMGDHFVKGVEANISYDWKSFGGFVSGSQLFENRVKNLYDTKFGSGSGVVNKEGRPLFGEIQWSEWNTLPDVDNKFNRSSIPRYNVSIGMYYDFSEKYTVSGIWKYHGDILLRHEEFWTDYYTAGVLTGGSAIDLSATAKDVLRENLNLSIYGKNVFNNNYLVGSAMDPGHFYEIAPVEYEVKLSYLW